MIAQSPRQIFATALFVALVPLVPAGLVGAEYLALLLCLGGIWLLRTTAYLGRPAISWIDAVVEGGQLGLMLLAAAMLIVAALHGISGILTVTAKGVLPFAAIGAGLGSLTTGMGKPIAARGQVRWALLGAAGIIAVTAAGVALRWFVGDSPDEIALRGVSVAAAMAASCGLEQLWRQMNPPATLRAVRMAHTLILGMALSLGPDDSIIGAWCAGLAACLFVEASLSCRDRLAR